MNLLNYFKSLALRGFIAIMFMAVTACQSNHQLPVTESKTEENRACLDNGLRFSFPYKNTGFSTATPEPLLPSLQEVFQTDADSYLITSVKQIIFQDENTMWLVNELGNVVQYQTTTQTISTYEAPKIAGISQLEIEIKHLYSTQRGDLLAFSNIYKEDGTESIFMSRYEKEHDSFEPIGEIRDVKGKAFQGSFLVGNYIIEFEDSLIVLLGNSLVLLDTNNFTAREIFRADEAFTLTPSLVSVGDGTLFIASTYHSLDAYPPVSKVLRIEIATGYVQDYGTPPEAEGAVDLFLDGDRRLWANDYGFIENIEHPMWQQIIRSPVFIFSASSGSPYEYGWGRPQPSLATKDQALFFTGVSGLVKLDMVSKEWCRLTSFPVHNIAKDSNEDVWFAANNSIYKYFTNK